MLKSRTKRLFFALWPDEAVRLHLQRLQKSLEMTTGGKMLDKRDLHITLQYLGQVRKDQMGCVEAAAARVEGVPFRLEIDSVHYWRRPRVLWAGLADIPVELYELARRLGEQLTPCGFPPEERSYTPHVTLARKVKSAAEVQLSGTVPWLAKEFVLVESHTDGRVPRYVPVARFPLDN